MSLVTLFLNRKSLTRPQALAGVWSGMLEGFKLGTNVICLIFQKDCVAVMWGTDEGGVGVEARSLARRLPRGPDEGQ